MSGAVPAPSGIANTVSRPRARAKADGPLSIVQTSRECPIMGGKQTLGLRHPFELPASPGTKFFSY